METLTLSGIPWFYCKKDECYRVRPGFKFPGFGLHCGKESLPQLPAEVLDSARTLVVDGKRFIESIERFIQSVEASAKSGR